MKIIKRYFKPILLLNFLLILLCTSGFLYQVYLIFNQYMLGKTVVNIEMKRIESQPLPAITIFIPHIISIEKLPKFSNFNQKSYQDYINLVNESNKNKTITDKVRADLNRFYRDIQGNIIGKTDSFDKLFKLSISNDSIHFTLNGKTKHLINTSIHRYYGTYGGILLR